MKTKMMIIDGIEMEVLDIKVGDKFTINRNSCEDMDVLDWYDGQVLIAEHVEEESNGVWVEDCDYRIDLNEIELVDTKEDIAENVRNHFKKFFTEYDIPMDSLVEFAVEDIIETSAYEDEGYYSSGDVSLACQRSLYVALGLEI